MGRAKEHMFFKMHAQTSHEILKKSGKFDSGGGWGGGGYPCSHIFLLPVPSPVGRSQDPLVCTLSLGRAKEVQVFQLHVGNEKKFSEHQNFFLQWPAGRWSRGIQSERTMGLSGNPKICCRYPTPPTPRLPSGKVRGPAGVHSSWGGGTVSRKYEFSDIFRHPELKIRK